MAEEKSKQVVRPRGRMSAERREEVGALVEKVKAGNDGALGELRALLSDDWEIWGNVANLERLTEKSLVDLVAGEPLGRELFLEHVDRIRRSLIGPNASGLERLLAGRLALTWLASAMMDRMQANALEQNQGAVEYWSKIAARLDHRFQHAAKTLALVQRLQGQLPLVSLSQTNISHADSVSIGQETPAPLGLEAGR